MDRDLLPDAARRGFLGRRALGQGMLIMTLSASLPLFQPSSSPNASGIHGFAVYMGLYLVALGTGGIKPCSSALGADQFDGADPAELVTKGSFFNWYYFAINIGSLLSATAIVWIQDNVGWSVGFGIPMLVMALGLAVFVAGRNFYRYKRRPPGHCSSPLTRVAQVVVAAVRNCRLELPDDPSALHELLLPSSSSLGSTTKEEEEGDYCRIAHTSQFRFLDKAAIVEENKKGKKKKAGPWKQCRVSQVEELKMLLRMSPVWASLLLFFAATAQMSSTLIEQGMAMDTRVFGFTVPPASLSTFDIASVLLWVPLYDALLVPLARRLTGESRGFTQRQRIGAGLALSALAMAYAAHVEAWRLSMAAAAARETEGKKRVGIMWQAPCYFVMGAAEVFASIGMLEYFYDQSPEGMKSLGTALAQLAIAGGNYLNSGLLGAVASATGWITDDLDEGHLDYFFWFMAALGVANLLQFVYCSTRHKG
ncbi:protein NRT1/ PTR FAMILY 8.3 isoform X2 [Brachypodium distachyon]|uniref:protein NRT1/ PTR FAMILY 8.3 isoform X2 n=1 Tax=Brachypodium distachyon TaxID=15368 RepID=UPI000D0CA547|nr:protein NRT1/ PTR FAMILY 8.3 isoform X2 [Brachypodium distachyon]|eukprot:XP_014758192.2 protein NRT1/ PTR FAMILY 8.3 isoform X2 [Brachypodium distachyon]